MATKNTQDGVITQLESVTRVEIIDNHGRSYVKWGLRDVQIQIQDDGRTLKLFLLEGI